jgi:hypothetical protein
MNHRRTRRSVTALARVTLLALATGCSDDSEAAPATTVGAPPATSGSTTTAPADPFAKGSAVPAAPDVVIDAPLTLQTALDAATPGTHFRTSVTVGGAEVLVAEGDRVGDGTRLTIWSNGTSVAYVVLPTGTWVFPEGGEWDALDDPPASTDPLVALRKASSVTGTANADGTASLTLAVDGATLGILDGGTVEVAVITTGIDAAAVLSAVRYSTMLDGNTAEVTTVFSPVVDPSPVVAPI